MGKLKPTQRFLPLHQYRLLIKMKKIAIMSFYESNSRYIHELSKIIKEETGRDTLQICMYPSSKNYCIKNSLEYIYLPYEVRNHKHDEWIDVSEKYYDFHLALFPYMGESFLEVSRKYWNYYKDFFPWHEFHSIVFIGDKRLYSSIGGYFAKINNVQEFYFEPGPYGTMIFDPKGVNCNMSISSISLEQMRKNLREDEIDFLFKQCISTTSERKFYEKNLGSYLRKIEDVLQSVPPKLFRKMTYIELCTGEGFFESIPYLLGRLPFKKNKKKLIPAKKRMGRYIFLALQVPNDVQVISNCKSFTTIEHMLSSVIDSLPNDCELIVREHPMNKGRYNKLLYSIINTSSRAHIDNDTPMNNLIDNAILVIVMNSTVGLEAAVRGASVLTLGDIYYPQIVNTLVLKKDLKPQILQAIENKASSDDVKLYIAYLFKYYMVKDNYKNNQYHDLHNAMTKICCH